MSSQPSSPVLQEATSGCTDASDDGHHTTTVFPRSGAMLCEVLTELV